MAAEPGADQGCRIGRVSRRCERCSEDKEVYREFIFSSNNSLKCFDDYTRVLWASGEPARSLVCRWVPVLITGSQGAALAAIVAALLEKPESYPPFLVDGKPPHPPMYGPF